MKKRPREEQQPAEDESMSKSSDSSSGSDSSDSESGRSGDSESTGGDAPAARPPPPATAARAVGVPVRVLRESDAGPDVCAPFVAYFANGRVPSFANDPGRPSGSWRFQVYESGGASQPQRRMLVSEQGAATLIGRPADPELPAPGCQYVLGVYDKEDGTLQLVGTQGGQVCRVESHTNGVNYGRAEGAGRDDADRRAEAEADIKARRAMSTRLVEAFGSTRRKRQLRAREEGAVRADKLLSAEAAEAALAAVNARAAREGGTREEVMTRVAARRNIPPHNPSATEPHKAYSIKDMVPDQCLKALNFKQLLKAADDPAVATTLTEKRVVPEYILSRLPLLRAIPATDGGARVGKARVLALLSALLNLVGQRGSALRVPQEGGLDALSRSLRVGGRDVLEPLLELFYHKSSGDDGGEQWVRDSSKRELQVLYCLVLALDAEGWTMAGPQTEALAEQLRMSLTDVAQRFRELGCSCTPVKGQEYKEGRSYQPSLLQRPARGGAGAPKTLEECLPKPKGPPKARGR